MMFAELLLVFLKIGIFTFGGGYAMVALIQSEVVMNHGWLTLQEFADILAVSQVTPGPFGINVATYTGFTAVVNAGYSSAIGVAGAVMCSVAVIALPCLLMIMVLRVLRRVAGNEMMQHVMQMARLAVLGLIAAAALLLVGGESFGVVGWNKRFVVSVIVFVAVFALSVAPKEMKVGRWRLSPPSPIVLIVLAGIVGLLVY